MGEIFYNHRQLSEPTPLHFIDEPIEVTYLKPPALEKRPTVPDAFTWREQAYPVIELLAEWFDHARRGRMARNMREAHARRAAVVGSWGVGRYFFRVRTASGQVFDIYYDRAPAGAADRKGHWFLLAERQGL